MPNGWWSHGRHFTLDDVLGILLYPQQGVLTLTVKLALVYCVLHWLIQPTASQRWGWQIGLAVVLGSGTIRALNRYASDLAMNNNVKDTYDWTKEIVLLTGGSGGIGQEIIRLLESRNIRVAVLDPRIPAHKTQSSCVRYYQCDITSVEDLSVYARQIRHDIGEPTVLMNNAGVAYGGSILESTNQEIRDTLNVNLLSSFWTIREFVPAMIKRNHGMVINMASFTAHLTIPGLIPYASSKAGVASLHEGLIEELYTRYNAPTVRTVLVTLGYTKTPLFDGWSTDLGFLLPPLEPQLVAEKIVEQMLSGKSGEIALPAIGWYLGIVRSLPTWLQIRLRRTGRDLMRGFRGRPTT